MHEPSGTTVSGVHLIGDLEAGLTRPFCAQKDGVIGRFFRWARGPTPGALAAPASDPVTRKLVEWVLLRDSDSAAGFDRFAAFNPRQPRLAEHTATAPARGGKAVARSGMTVSV